MGKQAKRLNKQMPKKTRQFMTWEMKCQKGVFLGTINDYLELAEGAAELFQETSGIGRYFWKRFDFNKEEVVYEFLNDKVGKALIKEIKDVKRGKGNIAVTEGDVKTEPGTDQDTD